MHALSQPHAKEQHILIHNFCEYFTGKFLVKESEKEKYPSAYFPLCIFKSKQGRTEKVLRGGLFSKSNQYPILVYLV